MSFVQNRFNALLGDEGTEVDKLGNTKPKEKKESESDKGPTRREVRRNGQRQPAVSPPSRRDRGNRREQTDAPEETTTRTTENVQRNERGRSGDRGFGGNGRGRPFDRHSGTGIRDNEKKVKQGWGEAGTAEFQGAHDGLNPNDPDAGERRRRGRFGDAVVEEEPEEEDNTKTLSEYLAERKNQSAQQLPEARKANDGNDDQWKGAVVLEKKEDSYFVGKNHEQKSKSKTKKEKVFLEIDQPGHQRSQRGGGRNNNNRNRGSRDNQGSVNLSDSNAFPNLSA